MEDTGNKLIQNREEVELGEPQRAKSGLARFLRDIIETQAIALLLFLGFNTETARIRVEGFSMEPSMHNGEFVLVNRLAYQFEAPSYGDVIVFHFPIDP